ncbi:HET-domain-containing protein [Hyaloscypha variabilis F]|uniref:HET-domain-containing protein n=1 Tax=Hyaloscypha variabilis (strain UAMH 11265 / GT02V1 / F) TaxID=1149755 RepID=A0A2J6R3C4_HYAVF|nr:HET-domain-containing protein [Hyaloscypha variabilis F]
MAQRYPYLPLEASEHQIRLLTLFPGEFPSINEVASPIEIEFQTISFGDANSQGVPRPKYEALSYTWGVERSPVPAMVKSQGCSKQSFVEMTQNLATALVYLRHNSEPRVLWIDALCINQEDMEERNSQVARMADIFRLADRVVVWLGPESEEDRSAEALSTLRFIGSQIEVDWDTYQMRATNQGDPTWADKGIPMHLDKNVISPVLMVFNRPWFGRLWIQQEIALANDNAVLICGHESIRRIQFTNAVYCFWNKVKKLDQDLTEMFQERLELIYEMAASIHTLNRGSLSNTLRKQAGKLKCSDPRDRMFAMLSITNPWDKVNIEADYSKTTEEVYRQFAVKHIVVRNNLDLLSACEVQTDHEFLHDPMPSWVPDWRRPIVTDQVKATLASGRSAAAAQFDCRLETLTLSGVKFATVTQVEPASIRSYSNRKNMDDFFKGVQKCIQFWGLSELYVTGENSHDTHVRTLCGNSFSESYNPLVPNFLNYEICSSKLNQCLPKGDIGKFFGSSSTSKFVNRIMLTCHGRSCFSTAEGYIGLAPAETKCGDIICILLGCDVPVVLLSHGEERYSIVGECYCHGIMDGSALLGPLPEGFELVWSFDQELRGYIEAYIDRRNGKVQGEDPRLAEHPLPPRWRIDISDEDNTDINFVQENDDGTEKERTAQVDPRMTPDELRKRGVNVVKFNLI